MNIEDLPSSVFPDSPDGDNLCIVCKIVKKRRHSWFCRKECGQVFIKLKS